MSDLSLFFVKSHTDHDLLQPIRPQTILMVYDKAYYWWTAWSLLSSENIGNVRIIIIIIHFTDNNNEASKAMPLLISVSEHITRPLINGSYMQSNESRASGLILTRILITGHPGYGKLTLTLLLDIIVSFQPKLPTRKYVVRVHIGRKAMGFRV